MNLSQQNTPENNEDIISPRQLLLHEIANKLVEARAAKKEVISKPVRKLKIQANHLQALENGNWDTLPDDVYVIGFLRQYSNYLDIDLSEEIDRLKNSDYTLTRPLTFPDPPVAPSRMWAWLTGGAFIVLFILFNVISNDDNEEDSVQATITPVAQNSIQTTNNTVSTDITTHVPKDDVKTPIVKERLATAPLTNSITTATGSAKTTTTTVKLDLLTPNSKPIAILKTAPSSIPPPSQSSNTATVPSQQMNTPARPATTQHVFRFEAVTAPIWMQVFLPNKAGNGKGRLLKEMLLKKGHHANIRYATETLWITCGNALALRIKVDNKTVIKTGGLGAGKKVLRDYRFDIHKQ